MKKNRGSWDFELLGAFAGLLIIVCAGIFLVNQEYAYMARLLAEGIGGELNAVLAVLLFHKKKREGGIVLLAVAVILLAMFFVQIAGVQR